jgi:hypothetical protein
MKNCVACQSVGVDSPGEHKDFVYGTRKGSTTIRLCYGHSVEFFKTGQSNFVLKYRDTVDDDLGSKDTGKPLNNYFAFHSFR